MSLSYMAVRMMSENHSIYIILEALFRITVQVETS